MTEDTRTRRIVVDPVTRIEGHLRVQVQVNGQNDVVDAQSTGTMWRGLEVILKGRDPRDAWAFVERICGVCTGVHALAAVRAVEDAIGIDIPRNANIIRNLMNAALYTHDHLVHFYQLSAPDWIDVVASLDADPVETAAIGTRISPHNPKASPGYFRDVQARLRAFVSSGQLGIFRNGYWGHPAMRLPPEVSLLALTHYIEVLDFQKEIVKIHAVLGGKNPHPNYLVGGVACPVNMHDTGAAGVMLNAATLSLMRDVARETVRVVETLLLPDVTAIAGFYPEWFRTGGGLSSRNLLAYGDFPEVPNDRGGDSFLLPAGAIVDGRLDEIHPVDPRDPDEIQEFVDHSWYRYADGRKGLHPWSGETTHAFEMPPGSEGTVRRFDWLGTDGKYSWIKSPRWRGRMMETGPLARLVIGTRRNMPAFREPAGAFLASLGLPFEALFSTMGRHAARALECAMTARLMVKYVDDLEANIRAGDEATANMERWEPSTWPEKCRGVGLCEAPRGALAHYCVIERGRIANWQAVVPTTWNASPRDSSGNPGPYEAALLGTHLADPERPLEILRTIHSFDPCLACATHVLAPDGEELVRVSDA